ncbi:hypothetical protein O181_073011 [Austropuccinia psidii MF-1]|uniref:Uncharacterized protein n=1 Tax=Austropuccinia psidii MF-1 TaxID=1389203 RepID=A0A9Q3F3S6_9BASI|nr:hypothetical protein [Austropuccinia psidii MF-1]
MIQQLDEPQSITGGSIGDLTQVTLRRTVQRTGVARMLGRPDTWPHSAIQCRKSSKLVSSSTFNFQLTTCSLAHRLFSFCQARRHSTDTEAQAASWFQLTTSMTCCRGTVCLGLSMPRYRIAAGL